MLQLRKARLHYEYCIRFWLSLLKKGVVAEDLLVPERLNYEDELQRILVPRDQSNDLRI